MTGNVASRQATGLAHPRCPLGWSPVPLALPSLEHRFPPPPPYGIWAHNPLSQCCPVHGSLPSYVSNVFSLSPVAPPPSSRCGKYKSSQMFPEGQSQPSLIIRASVLRPEQWGLVQHSVSPNRCHRCVNVCVYMHYVCLYVGSMPK